jgi:EAL domain-containing protein (putative c-di-GMP-specific phosphodiesterase class I)
MEVTAEGIETAQQLQKLRELKCEYGQGYFFSKPLESKAIEALIMADSVWL